MDIRTKDTPIRALIDSDVGARISDPRYSKMLDNAILAYEHSKVVSDRELELFAVGVEIPQRWAVALQNN